MSYVDPVHGKDLLDVLEGKLNSKLSQEKPRRMWLDDIRSWTGLDSYEKIKNLANDRKSWRACSIDVNLLIQKKTADDDEPMEDVIAHNSRTDRHKMHT